MKLTATCVLVIILGVYGEAPAQIQQYDKACKSSSGATSSQVDSFHAGTFTDDVKIKQYAGCMLKSSGVINSAGKIQVSVLKPRVPKDMKKEDAMKIFMSCKSKKGADVDETAYLLYKCFYEASPRHLKLDGF